MSIDEALALAEKHGLQFEVELYIFQGGYTPEEALREWDIL